MTNAISVYSTKDISEITHLSLRKVQYYAEKNVIKANKQKAGRGYSYVFTPDDVIRFLIVAELSRFKIPFEDIFWTVSIYFLRILKDDSVKNYLENKLYLEGKYFYLWVEWPFEGDDETILDCMVETLDQPFPESYFVQDQETNNKNLSRFYGFKFVPASSSAMIIDMASIYNRKKYFDENLLLLAKSMGKRTARGKSVINS